MYACMPIHAYMPFLLTLTPSPAPSPTLLPYLLAQGFWFVSKEKKEVAITRGLPERFLFSFFFLRREGVVARGMMKRVEREREREREREIY